MNHKAHFKGDIKVDGQILGPDGNPIGDAAPGVGDKLAIDAQLSVTAAGGEPLFGPGPNRYIHEQQGDSITINSDGRLVVVEGIYSMSLVVGFVSSHGDATHIRVRLSDYDTPSWGPNILAAVGGSDGASAVASGTWVFPEDDTLNFYIGHDGSSALNLSYALWIVKIA